MKLYKITLLQNGEWGKFVCVWWCETKKEAEETVAEMEHERNNEAFLEWCEHQMPEVTEVEVPFEVAKKHRAKFVEWIADVACVELRNGNTIVNTFPWD